MKNTGSFKFYKTGSDAEAENLFSGCVKKEPEEEKYLLDLSLVLYQLKKYDALEECYLRLLSIDPNSAVYNCNLGVAYSEKNQLDKAIDCYKKALVIDPNDADTYSNMGVALIKCQKVSEAIQCYMKAIELNPEHADAHNNLGFAYSEKNQLDKAIDCYKKALVINPNHANAYSNMGFALKCQNKVFEAMKCYMKAIELNPKYIQAHYNLGILYKDTMQIKESLDCYKKVIELNPQHPQIYFALAISLLLGRNFEAGWKAYENRINVQEIDKIMSPFLKPRWNGESLEGKNIYVLPEQGFGDITQFSRFLPYLKKLGAKRVFFKSPPEMISLFEESKLLGVEIIAADAENTLDFDYYIPLLSLPYYLKINEYNIPFTDKYLRVNNRKINKYKKKFFNNEQYKIGIFWQGSKTYVGDTQRSLALKYFYPLFSCDNVAIYSIQKGLGSEQLDELPDEYKIVNLGKECNDFSDTAAAIENLDLVISVDSSVAHLAAALGKEVWIIISEIPEWRWGQEEDSTIWYKSARLFRPVLGAGKHEVMSRVFKALDQKL